MVAVTSLRMTLRMKILKVVSTLPEGEAPQVVIALEEWKSAC